MYCVFSAYLAHKLGDYTVKCGALVSESFLTSAESAEVLGSSWYNVGTEGHLDAADWSAIGTHIKENDWVGHG